MITIRKARGHIMRILGTQAMNGRTEKALPFLIRERTESGDLVLNVLTGELTLFEEGDDPAEVRRYQKAHWYTIPAWVDGNSILYAVRNATRTRWTPNLIKTATVYTTTACNARCPYCFEHLDARHMTDETAAAAAEYIIRHADPAGIRLRLFGGEPFLNRGAVETIAAALDRAGLPFRTSAFTNGVLLQDVCGDDIRRWHLENVQITLDGTKARYEEIRRYPEPDGFEKVISVIRKLDLLGIRVSVRMNLGLDNTDDLTRLFDILMKDLCSATRTTVYVNPLYDGEGGIKRTGEQWRQTFSDLEALEDLISQTHFAPAPRLPSFRARHCMADSAGSVMIGPEGQLTPCEHFCETEVYGTIYGSAKDKTVLSAWKRTNETERCRECALWPSCVHLEKCPSEMECNEHYIAYRVRKIRKAMRRIYEDI